MRSGPTVELVTESGDSRPRMWPLTQAPPTVLRSFRSRRTEAGSLLLLHRAPLPASRIPTHTTNLLAPAVTELTRTPVESSTPLDDVKA